MTALFDSYVMVDWSAASKPTPARPSPDAIWWCLARRQGAAVSVEVPVYERTRRACIDALKELLRGELAAGRRVLVGFDFPFGYPAGVAARITDKPSALALWDWLSDAVQDGPDNANNRFEIAERINALYAGAGPFWGRPAGWDFPGIPEKGSARHGDDHPPERRLVEKVETGAQPVWKLYTTGSVGSQVLLGLPALNALRREFAEKLTVWPFETGLKRPDAPIVLAEIYPSMLEPDASEEIKDAGQVKAVVRDYATRDAAGQLAPLFEPPMGEADRRVVVSEEAWILGARQKAPKRLRYIRDPKEIYAESFATVRAEAHLDHLPESLHPVAIRLVHSCGMPDMTARLAWSPDVHAAASGALRNGAPVLCDCEAVASSVVRSRLPAGNEVICTLAEPQNRSRAAEIANTRSAAAVEFWHDRLEGAVVAIGNAPTALFHLLELIDDGWPKPAAILGFPVGFVGAAESKAELAANPRGIPFLTLRGRRGGSAMAAAAVNAFAAGLTEPA